MTIRTPWCPHSPRNVLTDVRFRQPCHNNAVLYNIASFGITSRRNLSIFGVSHHFHQYFHQNLAQMKHMRKFDSGKRKSPEDNNGQEAGKHNLLEVVATGDLCVSKLVSRESEDK